MFTSKLNVYEKNILSPEQKQIAMELRKKKRFKIYYKFVIHELLNETAKGQQNRTMLYGCHF